MYHIFVQGCGGAALRDCVPLQAEQIFVEVNSFVVFSILSLFAVTCLVFCRLSGKSPFLLSLIVWHSRICTYRGLDLVGHKDIDPARPNGLTKFGHRDNIYELLLECRG